MKRLRSHPSAHVVYGWLSLNHGGKGDRAFPKGFDNGGGEGGQDYGLWCRERVEQALSKYAQEYDKVRANMGKTSERCMRWWLKEIYWQQVDEAKFGLSFPMVYVEVWRFLKFVSDEVSANPRQKFEQIA